MKKFHLSIAFLFIASFCFAQDIASCCTSPKDEGRCTGLPSCTVCKNCSRCAHCGSGGSCGVCREPEEPKKTKTPGSRSTSNTKSRGTTSNDDTDVSDPAQFTVTSEINLRSGAGENFAIIEKIRKGTKVVKLGENGAWSKVRVLSSNKTGYVLTKHIR